MVEQVILLAANATVVRDRLRADPGGDRSGRTDDSPAAVRTRLDDYAARTLPLLKFYRKRGVPVVTIRVTARMTAAEMYAILEREVQA
jgi:adenylate kinase family enzyme